MSMNLLPGSKIMTILICKFGTSILTPQLLEWTTSGNKGNNIYNTIAKKYYKQTTENNI